MSNLKRANRPRARWWGYTTQFFLITVLPLTALILGIVFISQSLHHDAMRSLVGDRDLKAVQAAASSLEQEINHRSAMISILARSLPQQGNPAACISGLSGSGAGANLRTLPVTPDEISSTFDAGLALFSNGGCLAASMPGSVTTWQGTFGSQAPGFLASVMAAEGARPVFSQPLGQAVMLVGVRMTGDQALVGAFTPAALFQGITNTLISSGTTTVLIVSRVSPEAAIHVLYRAGPEKPDEQNPNHPGIKEALSGQSGISYFQSSQGEHVVAYSPISPTGWGLVIEEAWEDIENPDLRASQYAPLVMVPVILLALAALWFGARRIVQPLQALEDRASALARGDFRAIHHPVGGIGEIRDLQEELVEMADQLQAAQLNLRSYIGAITAGVESERRSLARELHDDTIQSLIALNQRIQMEMPHASTSDKEALAELQRLLQQTMEGLRRTIRGLRPIYLEDLGLVASLEMLAAETGKASGLAVVFHKEGTERRLNPDEEMALYRMAQESLSNVVRHAQAKQANLALIYTPDGLRLEITDDGKGFKAPTSPADYPRQGHFGLIGLHERAALIGASLEIISAPGQGTRVVIQLAQGSDSSTPLA